MAGLGDDLRHRLARNFEAYNGNQRLMAKFAAERAPFEGKMVIDRFFGEVDYAL